MFDFNNVRGWLSDAGDSVGDWLDTAQKTAEDVSDVVDQTTDEVEATAGKVEQILDGSPEQSSPAPGGSTGTQTGGLGIGLPTLLAILAGAFIVTR